MNILEVSQILYAVDPMNTACKENLQFDEYTAEAKHIAELVEKLNIRTFEGLYDLVKTTFSTFFWESCVSEQQLKEIANEIYKLTGVCQRS